MQKTQKQSAKLQVKGVLDYDAFASADMVIEAVIEDVKLKQTIFADLVSGACACVCVCVCVCV